MILFISIFLLFEVKTVAAFAPTFLALLFLQMGCKRPPYIISPSYGPAASSTLEAHKGPEVRENRASKPPTANDSSSWLLQNCCWFLGSYSNFSSLFHIVCNHIKNLFFECYMQNLISNKVTFVYLIWKNQEWNTILVFTKDFNIF